MNRRHSPIGLVSIFILVVFTAIFSGCAFSKPADSSPSLWVVTEKAKWDGMNSQIEEMSEVFQKLHPEFSVNLDILSEDEAARESEIQRIRTAMMSGNGPDIFLLPTSNTSSNYSDRASWVPLDLSHIVTQQPLFKDIEQAMRNGLFLDVSSFYDADDALGTEFLNTAIMDAGTIREGSVRDGRYILPLRFDFPVLFADKKALKEYGLTIEDADCNIIDLMELAIAPQSHKLACSVEPQALLTGRNFSFLGQMVDYESGDVTATKENVSQLLRSFQQVEQLVGGEVTHRVRTSLASLNLPGTEPDGPFFQTENAANLSELLLTPYEMFPYLLPMRVGTLEDAIVLRAFSKAEDWPITMLPIKGVDEKLTACVTYFGAIGAGCEHPQEAYEFLRLFLTEDAQYERNRPWWSTYFVSKPYRLSLIEAGWPVRSVNGTEHVWNILKTASRSLYQYGLLPRSKLEKMHITEEEFSLPEVPIDHVYFGSALEQELSIMARSLNDLKTGAPTDADIDAMAEEFIKELKLQLLEG